MTLDRIEICRRLSPSTFQKRWMKERFHHLSFRSLAMHISAILISCLFYQTMLHALIIGACAVIAILIHRTPVSIIDFYFHDLPRFGKEEIDKLNSEIISEILGKNRSVELRCLIHSEFCKTSHPEIAKKWTETIPYYALQRLHRVDPSLVREQELAVAKQILNDSNDRLEWIRMLKNQLQAKAELYIEFINHPLRLNTRNPRHVKAFSMLVNAYATIALEAIANPYSSLIRAA